MLVNEIILKMLVSRPNVRTIHGWVYRNSVLIFPSLRMNRSVQFVQWNDSPRSWRPRIDFRQVQELLS